MGSVSYSNELRSMDKRAQSFYLRLKGRYVFDGEGEELLLMAAGALSTYLKAQAAVNRFGVMVKSPVGPKRNPAIEIAKSERDSFTRIMKRLGLEDEKRPVGRPPKRTV